MALSRGVSPRPPLFVAQADAQPFAALLDAAAAPVADSGTGAPAASAQPNQQKPPADTGAAAQDGAAASAPPRPAGNDAHGPAAPDNGAPGQSTNAATAQGAAADNTESRKPIPAPDGNDLSSWAPPAPANGMPIQTANSDGTHLAAKNGGDLKPGLNTNKVAITPPPPLPPAAGSPNASSGASANPTRNGAAPFANDPAASDAAAAGQSASDNSAAARLAAVIADLSGSTTTDGVAPGVTKPSAGGKDDQNDQQQNSPADAAAASTAAGQAQASSPAPTQPLAAAVAVNVAPDSAPPAAAKPGLAIADAVKARAKIVLTPATMGQTAPAQDDSTDAPGSSSAADSGNTGATLPPAGSDDSPGDASIANAQQVVDQLPAFTATSATLLAQIDFTSLGGTERFGLRGETAASLNGAAASAAPSGAPNAATAPNVGIFAPIIATNLAAPAAAAEPAVPLAGLAVAIAGRAQAGSSQFDIRLDPPELGRIDVRLDVDGSGQVRTHVTVDRADTLQLLQSQQPQLERALEQAGLKTADNGLQFTLRDQSFAGQNGQTGGQHYANQPAAPLVIPDIDAAPIDTAQIYARLRLGNGLDISV